MSSRSTGSSRSIRWTKNSRLPFGPGSPESTTPTAVAPHPRAGVDHLAQHAAVDLRVADDAALARPPPPGLELRLDEHERLPAGLRAARSTGGSASRTLMKETSQTSRSGRTAARVELARVRPLEHGDARVVAQPRVQLAVADVDGDHARGAALEQEVGEAARRRADVDRSRGRRARRRAARARSRASRRRARRSAAAARPRARRRRRPGGPACRSRGRGPASTSACACARLSASPRSTSRTSSRFFIGQG